MRSFFRTHHIFILTTHFEQLRAPLKSLVNLLLLKRSRRTFREGCLLLANLLLLSLDMLS
ncbi:hypothetical protein PI125_g4257 [Phytophthora idaei]|nr:hypothetical protein PI125_g4257 [Phytophthora idaei]